MRYRRFAVLVLALCSIAPTAPGQTLPNGVQKVTSIEGVNEYAFPNGLHVLLFPDNSKPKITVNVVYMVGSRNEGYGETGMAHLLEHMTFKGTKSGREVFKELTDRSACPWDKEPRRPSHADRRNALRRQCLTNEFSLDQPMGLIAGKIQTLWNRIANLVA